MAQLHPVSCYTQKIFCPVASADKFAVSCTTLVNFGDPCLGVGGFCCVDLDESLARFSTRYFVGS